jgi:hypothetical protein
MFHRLSGAVRVRKRVLIPPIVLLAAVLLAGVPWAVPGHGASVASAGTDDGKGDGKGAAKGLGQLSGLLPRENLTEESALQVDLTHESVRLPLYPGMANGHKVWYLLLDASDAGLAHDLGVNYAPKLANLAIGCAGCVQTVHLESPTPAQNRFGPAVVDFAGAPDFSPTRIAVDDGHPFDVVHHTNTSDRALGIHIAGPSPAGQFNESWADMLFVKGFDAGQPIVYLSTDAGQPLTAVLERSTFVPALDQAAYNGGDDFLGSARERLFGFINGQTGADNRQAQGFQHLALDGHVGEDASAGNTALINALRNGGDLLNVFGDFPTLADPRHAQAYSPLWDAQLGLWTPKAVQQGLNTRQIDEVQVFNLAATRPDLLTGVDPATGQPAPYGAAGVDINCAVIGFTAKAPTANLATPAPNSQFPPR